MTAWGLKYLQWNLTISCAVFFCLTSRVWCLWPVERTPMIFKLLSALKLWSQTSSVDHFGFRTEAYEWTCCRHHCALTMFKQGSQWNSTMLSSGVICQKSYHRYKVLVTSKGEIWRLKQSFIVSIRFWPYSGHCVWEMCLLYVVFFFRFSLLEVTSCLLPPP